MNTNPDDWWLRRRHPPVSPGDAWSGRGEAYRAWMGAKARPGPPVLRAGAEASLLLVAGAPLRWLKGSRCFRAPLGWIAAGSVAVVLLTPLAWAGRTDPCAAAEVALIDGALGRDSRFGHMRRRVAAWTWPDGGLFAQGQVGRQIAFEEHPLLPSLAGCTALFWRARIAAATAGRFTPASSMHFIILR